MRSSFAPLKSVARKARIRALHPERPLASGTKTRNQWVSPLPDTRSRCPSISRGLIGTVSNRPLCRPRTIRAEEPLIRLRIGLARMLLWLSSDVDGVLEEPEQAACDEPLEAALDLA